MNNLNKFRKSTVAILTALLIIAIAAPLVSFAAAAGAPTASLGTASGPNGTLVKVSGTGFNASDTVAQISVSIDGLANKAITTSGTAPTGATGGVKAAYQLKTDANGVLTGYFIIYNLSPGAHTVIISDPTTSVVAGTFTITKPTVTISPSSLTAGTSVTVSGSNFPTTNTTIETMTYNILSANFSGNNIVVANGFYTSLPSVLSSNQINNSSISGAYLGTYTATVSLPAVTTTYGAVFNLTDTWNNVAGTTLSLTTPTVTLSPTSGPVGTIVTATVTGFGPATSIAGVSVGNVVGSTSPADQVTPVAPATTEQGSAVFLFKIPAGTNTTKAGVAGAQAITVTDLMGNVGTATFTVTPKVAITIGTAAVDSGTTYVPVGATSVIRINATGFKPEAVLTFGYSPNVPAEWTTPSTTTWSPITQINADNQLLTNANGAVDTVVSATGIAPTQIGQYWISVSDGTTTVTTTFNVVAAGDIVAVPVATGAAGQTGIQIKYFGSGTLPTGVVLGTTAASASGLVAASAWPAATTATFTVPARASGVQRVALVGGAFNTVPFTTVSPSVTVVNPTSASVGTTVTVVGNGFANIGAGFAIDGATVAPVIGSSAMLGNTLLSSFVVPNYLPGTYSLSFADTVNAATTSFTVASSQIQITPTTSTPTNAFGSAISIAITGSGFKASDTLTVKFDNTVITAANPIGLTVVNTNGGIIINSNFTLPTTTTAGSHTITVQGSTGAYAQATFTITPKLATLAAVRPGAAVAVSGIGFAANSVETLTVNGTATTWLNVGGSTPAALPSGTTVKTQSNGNTYNGYTVGFVVSSTETSTALLVAITDAAGNTASTTLTILATPAIMTGAPVVIANTPIAMGVSINGTGFTPSTLRVGGTPVSAALYSGSTLVAPVTLSAASITVASTGSFAAPLASLSFVVPASVTSGTYTLQFTIGSAGVSTPVETASTTVTVLGAPSIVAPASAASGSNVTITVSGLTAISGATFNGVAIASFGPTTVPNTGANAYTKATWFILPTNVFAGSYLLTLTDSNTGLTVQSAIQVTPSMVVAPTTASKGTPITVVGSGFAPTSTLTAKVNGVALNLNITTSNSTGGIAASFTVPVTAVVTNTLSITDASGNAATATFNVTAPTLTLPVAAQAGTTVQIIGDGFAAGSSIVIQVGGTVVTTVPAAVTANAGGSFIAYVTAPSVNSTVTATDNSNNIGTATLVIAGTSIGSNSVPNQGTMTTTAQTTTPSGTATSTFTAGTSTVNAGFVLQTTGSPRDVVVAVTWQGPGGRVYNMASFQTTMDSNARTVSFSNLIPAGVTGTWTVQLQVFASDGVTALGVQSLTFTAQ